MKVECAEIVHSTFLLLPFDIKKILKNLFIFCYVLTYS